MLALLSSSGSVVTSGTPTKKVPVNSSNDSRKTKMLAATIPGVDYVCSDNAAGAELAANQLLRSGWLNTLPSTWAITPLLDAGLEYRRFGAGALMLAHVAAGQLHAYYEAHMNSWDALAGMQLIEEAGGTCNAFLANEGLRRGNRVLAGCAGVQPRLAALLEK